MSNSNYCLLIPHYNHERQFVHFLPQLLATKLSIIVVDDGSSHKSLATLEHELAQHPSIYLIKHPRNRGKGAAVKSGMTYAAHLGFSHAIQIDSDGQHCVEDIATFITHSKAAPNTLICGRPVFDASAPKARVYGRKVTDFWVAIETLSLKVKDSLCGFRVYPLAQCEKVFDRYYIGSRMDFDTDMIVKTVWLNIDTAFIDTQVVYPENSVSHFNYLRDNLLLISLHTRLMLGMFIRLPAILLRRTKPIK